MSINIDNTMTLDEEIETTYLLLEKELATYNKTKYEKDAIQVRKRMSYFMKILKERREEIQKERQDKRLRRAGL